MDTDKATKPAAASDDELLLQPSAPEHEEAPPVESEEGDWSGAKVEERTGIALDGDGLPINHRLRAERLAKKGKDSDPGEVISDELIAHTKDRLEREAKARPPVRENMKTAELERIAKGESIDLSSATNNADRVALIIAARGGEEVA